jgi:hypothetical protein
VLRFCTTGLLRFPSSSSSGRRAALCTAAFVSEAVSLFVGRNYTVKGSAAIEGFRFLGVLAGDPYQNKLLPDGLG